MPNLETSSDMILGSQFGWEDVNNTKTTTTKPETHITQCLKLNTNCIFVSGEIQRSSYYLEGFSWLRLFDRTSPSTSTSSFNCDNLSRIDRVTVPIIIFLI